MPVLALISDYMALWQLPVFLLMAVVWIAGGAHFLRRAVLAHASRREANFARCMMICVLAGIGGALGAGVIGLLAASVAARQGIAAVWLIIPAGVVAFVLASFVAVYVSFHLPFRQAVGNWLRAFGVPLAAIAVIAIPSAALSYSARQSFLTQQHSVAYLQYLYRGISRHYLPSRPPTSLEDLVKGDVVSASYLLARKHPDRRVGFFYMPAPIKPDNKNSRKVLACDWLDNLDGSSRVVLYDNGKTQVLTSSECKSVFALDENKAFAVALREAEKKILGGKGK